MTIDLDRLPLARVAGGVFRIVANRFPPIGLWDRIADPADFAPLAEVEALTNPRIREELAALQMIPAHRRVAGPGTTPIMAAFTHINPESTRFSDGSFGVFYAARAVDTAIRETVYHRERFLAHTRQPAQQISVRCYVSGVRAELHDARGAFPELHDPDPGSYLRSSAVGRALRERQSSGVVYDSVRHRSGQCVAVFWPDCLDPCVQGAHFAYRWDGSRITDVMKLESVPI